MVTWQILPKEPSLSRPGTWAFGFEKGTSPRSRTSEFSLSLDFEATWGGGEDSQYLGSLDDVELANEVYEGPGQLDMRCDIFQMSAAGRAGAWIERTLAFEGIAGIAVQATHLKIQFLGHWAKDTNVTGGPVLGGRITLRPIQPVYVYGEYLVSIMASNKTFGLLWQSEGGVVVEPAAGVGLFLGWRSWDYCTGRKLQSGLDFKTSGPLLGLRFRF